MHRTIPTALRKTIDVDRVASTAARFSDGRFAIGILAHGTCFFPTPGKTFAQEADVLISGLQSANLNFVVREMDDGNYVVRFTEYLFAIVFRDEFEGSRDQISEDARSSESLEVFLGDAGRPQDHLLIGLYARTRLLADIELRKVVRTVQAASA